MGKRKLQLVIAALMISVLTGCSNQQMSSQTMLDALIKKGIPEESIQLKERKSPQAIFERITILDDTLGVAELRVYDRIEDADKYWDNLEEYYDNLTYIDMHTAVGDVKDLFDASEEDWIYHDGNLIVIVPQYVASEWAIYTGEDGELYYEDGSKVADDVPSKDQRAKAEELEKIILDCLSVEWGH